MDTKSNSNEVSPTSNISRRLLLKNAAAGLGLAAFTLGPINERLMALHDEAQNNAYDLHDLLGTRLFEQGILIPVCDAVAFEAALNELYPELHVRPEPRPNVAEAETDEMTPAEKKAFWEDTALKMHKLAQQAWANAEALG